MRLGYIQSAVLLGFGLQYKKVEEISKELNLQVNQILPLFNKIMKKFSTITKTLYETQIKDSMAIVDAQSHIDVNQGIKVSMEQELEETGKEQIKQIYHSGEKR